MPQSSRQLLSPGFGAHATNSPPEVWGSVSRWAAHSGKSSGSILARHINNKNAPDHNLRLSACGTLCRRDSRLLEGSCHDLLRFDIGASILTVTMPAAADGIY